MINVYHRHRVVRSDFSIGGYESGEEVKLEVLARGERGYEEPKKMEVNGKLLPVFPVQSVWKT